LSPLPFRPDLGQLRRQARELQRAAEPLVRLSEAQLALAREYGFASWAKLKAEVLRRHAAASAVTVRPVGSVEELIRTEQVIAAQFPPRRSAPSHGLEVLEGRLDADRGLMLLAETDGQILGGALALRIGDAVRIDMIALKPDWRRLGIGRRLMEVVEAEARRVGARSIYLGGANAENRAFYWRLGYSGRKLMQKGLPLAARIAAEH
jgi:GNAT superfamily N-acetyltransferase